MRGERVVPGTAMLFTEGGGRQIWTDVASVPIRDAAGQVTGQVTAIHDTDAATRGAEALRTSEERLAFLLNLSDALRPLTDGGEIEQTATRLLGEHLKADRCFLSPVYEDGSGMCVREEYVRAGASSVLGDYTFASSASSSAPSSTPAASWRSRTCRRSPR